MERLGGEHKTMKISGREFRVLYCKAARAGSNVDRPHVFYVMGMSQSHWSNNEKETYTPRRNRNNVVVRPDVYV